MVSAPGGERTVVVLQGDHRISRDAGDVLVTVLGSCVAACMRDPVAGIGGLNHFLLPGPGSGEGNSMKYGLHAMELLINGLIRAGAHRGRLEAKLFGGARMRAGLTDVGSKNAAFAEEFLRAEGIPHVGGSLGGDRGRKIRYWPVTGDARQFLLAPSEVPVEQPVRPAAAPPAIDDITLF